MALWKGQQGEWCHPGQLQTAGLHTTSHKSKRHPSQASIREALGMQPGPDKTVCFPVEQVQKFHIHLDALDALDGPDALIAQNVLQPERMPCCSRLLFKMTEVVSKPLDGSDLERCPCKSILSLRRQTLA